MNKIKKFLLFIIILLGLQGSIASAEEILNVNLTIRDGSNIIFENTIPLRPTGDIELNGHALNADSVLSVLNDADVLSDNFLINDLQYYESYGSFYVKCINNKCDNWQFTVNGQYSPSGMDKIFLVGGENIYVYFGPQHKTTLSSNSIDNRESLTVTTEDYDYQNNSWTIRTGVTVGLTQVNPNDIWNPIEIDTKAVNMDGKAVFNSIPTGSYNIGIKEDFYFPTEALVVTEPAVIATGGSSGGNNYTPILKNTFDANKALEFLLSKQKENGSFGLDLYTDWIAISFGTTEKYTEQKNKLIKYFNELKPKEYQLTDYERHAMALMSLGLNPYNTNNENYIQKILSNFDGKQFGNISQNNDDIFALIVLGNAGFTKEDEIISKTIEFLLNEQKANGSWNESIDMTSAGIISLSRFNDNKIADESIKKAKNYLKEKQNENGGWENTSSTSWVMGSIIGLSEEPKDWIKNNNSPLDYLGTNQDNDGGMKNENMDNKIWETSYAITASSNKNWIGIMKKFEKMESKNENEIKESIEKQTTQDKTENIKKEKKIIVKKDIELKNEEKTEKNKQVNTSKRNWLFKILSRLFNL